MAVFKSTRPGAGVAVGRWTTVGSSTAALVSLLVAPCGSAGTSTRAPSASDAARLSAWTSACGSNPAAVTASSTRAPGASVYTPGSRTAPTTCTVTGAGGAGVGMNTSTRSGEGLAAIHMDAAETAAIAAAISSP